MGEVPAAHWSQASFDARDSLRRYLIRNAEELRQQTSTPQRDAELAELEGWIRWLRGAI